MNLNFTTLEISQTLDATCINEQGFSFNQIFIDSRSYFGEKNRLFIAIKGPSNDGHKYIEELINQGCKMFIVEHSFDFNFPEEVSAIKVDDTKLALQTIAAAHRKKFDCPVIAITGSNGKTIIKEWLYHFLKNKYRVIRSPKSYNSQIGVPLSLLQIGKQHNLVIIEAGISMPGEMQKLERMIQPTCGIFTHLGTAHSENFKNQTHLKSEKSELFKSVNWFHNFEDNSEINTKIYYHEKNSELEFYWKGEVFKCIIPFTDDASIQNALSTIGFLLKFGISSELIKSESPHLPSVALRLEARSGKNQNIIINDTYSNDLDSLSIALNYVQKSTERTRKALILSDIQQDSHNTEELYSIISEHIQKYDLHEFYGVGEEIFKCQSLFTYGKFFKTAKELLAQLKKDNLHSHLILIKGARNFALEKVGKFFEHKTHETKLTIDLDALRHNVKEYQSKLNPKTKLLCMVKAYGYGSGSKEIGKILEQSQVDYLGVAYADEGEELRSENIQLPIIVMNPEEGSFDKIIENKLEPSIYSFKQLDEFIRALIDLGIKSYPIHVKLDTGMKRLGFLSEEIEELISMISSQPEVRVKSIFSHLAASDNQREDMFTNKQIQIFQYACHQIETGIGYNCIKHILNTGGIERFGHAQMDMVRLGLGMYGLSSEIKSLKTVGSLTSVISQIKKVKKGESVGYNRSQYALNDMTIGVVPIGYADGFSRSLSDGKGHFLINGQLAPIFGKVCMDMTMIDLTKVTAHEGDQVEVFGENRPIQDLAKEMNTITYEVMTSVSQRVVRIYID